MKIKLCVQGLLVLLLSFMPGACSEPSEPPLGTDTFPVATTSFPAPPVPVTTPVGKHENSAAISIASSSEEYSATIDALELIIPPGTFPPGTTISMNMVEQLIDHSFSGFKSAGLFEITASQTGEFPELVTLEFAFEPSVLNSDYDVADQVAVAYYDEDYNAWQEVDFVIDEQRGKIIVETGHFSLWSYFFTDEKQVIMKMPGFTIYFNQELDAPVITSGMSGQPIFEYAAIIRSGLYDAYNAYGDMGFKLPEHTRVYVDNWGHDKEAEWGWFSKNIEIPVSYIYQDELIMVAAHEFFHSVQNQYVNFYTMSADRWWIEATADYAAAHVASSYGLKEKLPYNYLNSAINSSETFHMYQTAHFVEFLVDRGLPFRELFEGVMSGSSRALHNLRDYVNSKGMSLSEIYDAFAYNMIFENITSAEPLKADIYTDLVKNKQEYDLDKAERGIEVVNVSSNYASALSGFQLESDTNAEVILEIRAIDPASGVAVRYVLASDAGKGTVISTGYLMHEAVDLKVEGGQYLYFLVTNFAPQNGYVTVVIEKGELDPQPYSHFRTASVYSNEYILDIEFNLSANTYFSVVEELIEGETLFVAIQFKRSEFDIVIDLEAITSEIRFTNPQPDRQPLIGEEYWSWLGSKTESNTGQLVISPDTSRPLSPYYDIIIRVENTATGNLSPKIDGATIIRVGIFFD